MPRKAPLEKPQDQAEIGRRRIDPPPSFCLPVPYGVEGVVFVDRSWPGLPPIARSIASDASRNALGNRWL